MTRDDHAARRQVISKTCQYHKTNINSDMLRRNVNLKKFIEAQSDEKKKMNKFKNY